MKPAHILSPSRPSDRALRAAALFGLAIEWRTTPAHRPHARHWARAAADILRALRTGGIVFITGPSGGGKSTLLRALSVHLAARGANIEWVRSRRARRAVPLIDTVPGSLRARLGALAHAGLAEPRLWNVPTTHLSEGQHARSALARAIARCPRHATGTTLLADEFCSPLDRITAWCVAASLARWARAAPARLVIVATAHDDLIEPLRPDVLVHVSLTGHVAIHPPPRPAEGVVRPGRTGGGACNATKQEASTTPAARFVIRPGTRANYENLSPHHYRAARPGPVCRVLVALDRTAANVVGALVVSLPPLNGPWRTWLPPCSARERARLINTQVRVISRVIIDPRYRGMGLATRLVRAYLARPLTPRTEALAAMGTVCPFFERAGMTATPRPRSARDARLLSALSLARLSPWRLAAWATLPAPTRSNRPLRLALRRWANDSRATRSLARASLAAIARAAATVGQRAVIFQHTGDHPGGCSVHSMPSSPKG
ncbi:MAG: GNAT family N-acetyltransferase [Phycisphaerales bacterium]